MKYIHIFIFLVAIFIFMRCTPPRDQEQSTIPLPNKMQIQNGEFEWNSKISIVIPEDGLDLIQNAEYLRTTLKKSYSSPIELLVGERQNSSILLSIDTTIIQKEGYSLSITKNLIEIKAKEGRGLFYGIQTLLNMMPPEVYKENGLPTSFKLQALSIQDFPQSAYRGMHLDVSRNFMSTDNVKKYIDLLAMYKFNTFHWHLTDGAGWRIEIKEYPLLTKKTAFRAQETWKEFWNEGERKFVDEGTPNAYGGYYTQDEVKEIVEYAAQRYITIIPEIEMPGHSEEVFVAYPQLSCSNIPYKDSDFCAGNEESFIFIENVLKEIFELFPSEYIHIGGDEASKTAWKDCAKCQKRIKNESLEDEDELQSYFIKRISNILTANGRKLIGWDEIMEGGLPQESTVMLWRDLNTGIKVASQGHDVIMTPGTHCYFDSYQANPATEPEAIGGYLPLHKVYSFKPIPSESLADRFIGGQANLWTEYMPNYTHVEYMAFPRAIALSEILWTPQSKLNWTDFKNRLAQHFIRLDYLGVNYRKPGYELEMNQTVDTVGRQIKVFFENEQTSPDIRYTLDGNIPDENSERYNDTILINQYVTLTATILGQDKQEPDLFVKNIGYHKAIGKKVDYLKKWTSYPAGGVTALTDGLFGSLTYSDDKWQGFTSDLEVIIDMEEEQVLNYFSANFMQLTGPGVYMPAYVEVFGSNDKTNFKSLLKITNDIGEEHDRLIFKNFSGSLKKQSYRYIKVFAKNNKGFLFTDELILD